MIENFDHEEEIKKYYEKGEDSITKIVPSSIPLIENPDKIYLFLNIK